MKCSICSAESNGDVCEFCGADSPQNVPDNMIIDSSNTTNTIINNYYIGETNIPQRQSFGNISAYGEKSKAAALLLCIFLGYFGIHYFYTGKIGMGIVYLFTGGLFGIGWLVDIVRIATGCFIDNRGYKLK